MPWLLSFLPAALALVGIFFLAYRLRFFGRHPIDGRFLFVGGGLLVMAAAGWQPIRMLSDYSFWFISQAYPVIDLVQMLTLAAGVLLLVAALALYADFWQTRREELEVRESRVSVLQNLQHDARRPLQILELLTIALKEILSQMPGCAGAVFLINRGKRQFVLATSFGLNRGEMAGLEQYPVGNNLVTQAVESGEPIIGGSFEFQARRRHLAEARFLSTLVLPLHSAMDRLGAIVLVAEDAEAFGRTEVGYLSPVADWLAEKIKSARLSRQLSLSNRKSETAHRETRSLFSRLSAAVGAITSPGGLNEFCTSMVGFIEADIVEVVTLSNKNLIFVAASESPGQLTEKYRAALVDAIERDNPLIINQEAGDEKEDQRIIQSTLVYPSGHEHGRFAILLRKHDGKILVDDADLRSLGLFIGVAGLALRLRESQRQNLARRTGFDRILKLLRVEEQTLLNGNPSQRFASIISNALPAGSTVAALVRASDQQYKLIDVEGANEDMRLSEKALGDSLLNIFHQTGWRFVFGSDAISSELSSYPPALADRFSEQSDYQGRSSFLGLCGIGQSIPTDGLIIVRLILDSPSDNLEWERFLTLASGLFGLRLAMGAIRQTISTENPDDLLQTDIVNNLNNTLAAVLGKAELISARIDLPQLVQVELQELIEQTEQAAAIVRSATKEREANPPDETISAAETTPVLNRMVESVLNDSRIADNLYMAGGRPHEIHVRLSPRAQVDLDSSSARGLFEGLLNRLGSIAAEEDDFTVTTYVHDKFVYLDLCRHRRNFPPVERVAGFGRFMTIDEALRHRPADTFLQPLTDTDSACAVDADGPTPAYFSCRFALKAAMPEAFPDSEATRVKILAIDDQPVILDLLVAMGKSQGYSVRTASSGYEGIRIAKAESFDIILTDFAMPDISGLEVARQLRQAGVQSPIVLVTGWEATLSRKELDRVGILEVLYKPFRIERLTEIVESSVHRNKV